MGVSSVHHFLSKARPLCNLQHKILMIQRVPSVLTHLPITAPVQFSNISTYNPLWQITKSTGAEHLHEIKKSWFKSLVQKLGWKFIYKGKFSMLGYDLYEMVLKDMNYAQFFKEFEMEDTFHSWFLIVELHIWMVCVRVMRDDEYGKTVRDGIIKTMWTDVEERSKNLMVLKSTQTAEVRELSEEFRAALLNYDEGLLSDDKVLAGAVWRRFFCKNCDNPLLIERMVHYIRRQISILEHTSAKDLFVVKKLNLITLDDVPVPIG